ncbi:MAG: thiamine pyrophosphate-dependent dehydrogenase E1 component subunit alpha, partial [Chloroflexi bacterium]|nr:thiamine pyrophosphate-dependent dehydrogenase E1 component subunit alpha [Chloroflexota bacterium]
MLHHDPSILTTGSLSPEKLLEMYIQMVRCRTLDERVWMLNRQGKAALVASSQGHEAAQIASVHALRPGQDWFYAYYRDLAVEVALGITHKEIMLGYLAKAGEPFSNARQFPGHGAYVKHRFINLSNVVATQITQAVGAALASKMRGEDTIAITYFGDGAASTGDCHEGMNFAAIHKLPVIFFCENNKYAISVPLSKQMAVSNVADRAQGYGMPGIVVDGTDIAAVYEAVSEAAKRARSGEGPTLIEAMVERYLPHTSDDDDTKYRSAEELEEARKHDPLAILKAQLLQAGALTEAQDKEIRAA